MSSRRLRDEWTEIARRHVAEVGSRVAGLVRPRVVMLLRRVGALFSTRAKRFGRRISNLGRRVGMKLPSSRFLFRTGWPILMLAAIIILLHFNLAPNAGASLATTELPLGRIRDVAADSRGRIYVADSVTGRVQRYSSAGEFERGWSVPAGNFALRTAAEDQVQVATKERQRLLTYDSDGVLLLQSRPDWQDNLYEKFASETETSGPYAVRNGHFAHVVDTRTGQTVVATPWYLLPIAYPFPTTAYVAIGLVLVGLGA